MHCSRCGFANPTGFTFCGKCGNSLAPACPRCGAPVPAGFAFCGKCGAPLHAANAGLSATDLAHLHSYLPDSLVAALRFDAIAPPPRLLESCLTHLNQLLNLTQSHLPAYLVEWVGHDPTPGRTAGQFVYGTLLFADISGFTAMSERLSRMGREGAEEITGIVNRYFNLMLAILRERDGQLIKFGGDALLALFLDPTPPVETLPQVETLHATSLPGDSATRATQAALTMQVAMGGFAQTKTSQGIFPLQMKIAVQRGRFFAAQLGTAQNMEHALFGADVNAIAAIEAAATAGQVVMGRETLAALMTTYQAKPLAAQPQYMHIEHIETASPLGAVPSVSLHVSAVETLHATSLTLANLKRTIQLLDALTPYLPAGLLARIAHNPQAISLEGEHRLVSLLFANVHGLGAIADRLGPSREAEIVSALNQYFVAMEHGVQQFGGVINKMDLSAHGDKLLAFFGAPLAHEDDAERAVRAALTMQQTLMAIGQSVPAAVGLYDLQLQQHIGVSYGYVFAGYVGTSWRHEYTVMGDEVNLAARLMSVAGQVEAGLGAIIASSNIQRKTQALFDFESRGTVNLKGKRLPVPIFAVQGVRALPEPLRGLAGMRSALVGRDAEWQQLQGALTQLLTGRGQIVSVIGEAGLGKSRLVAELRQQTVENLAKVSNLRKVRWHEGRCLSYTETVSYTPCLELMRQLTGIANEDGEEVAWNKLRESVTAQFAADEAQQQLPYLATFLNLTLTSDLQEKVRYLDAEALQRRTFVALSAFIEAYARCTPLVLELEDLHWVDQASQALIEHLMPVVNRAPLLLLLLYRPDRDRRGWQLHEKAVREFAYCHTAVTLQKLSTHDSQQILVNLVQFDQWPPEMQPRILARAEGNPLYLEEVIRSLIDAQALVKDAAGHWQLVNDAAVRQVPDTLQGVIMARLDRLPEACRWTAMLASVIGRVFALDVLENISGTQLVSLRGSLSAGAWHLRPTGRAVSARDCG